MDAFLTVYEWRDDLGAAIERLQGVVDAHVRTNSPFFVGVAVDALMDCLIKSGSAKHLAEARQVLHRFDTSWAPLGLAVFDLWLTRWRAIVARASGYTNATANAARVYLDVAVRLDARGRLEEARRMVAESTGM